MLKLFWNEKDWKKMALSVGLVLFSVLLVFNIVSIVVTIQRIGLREFVAGTDMISEKSAVNETSIKVVKVLATAYSSTADQTDSTPCITANGFNVCDFYQDYGYSQTVAANFLPMNSIIKIPELYGDRLMIVRDRMNARYGSGRMDIWMPTRSQALVFGKRWIEIQVFE